MLKGKRSNSILDCLDHLMKTKSDLEKTVEKIHENILNPSGLDKIRTFVYQDRYKFPSKHQIKDTVNVLLAVF